MSKKTTDDDGSPDMLQQLSQRFLTLWQEQLSLMNDAGMNDAGMNDAGMNDAGEDAKGRAEKNIADIFLSLLQISDGAGRRAGGGDLISEFLRKGQDDELKPRDSAPDAGTADRSAAAESAFGDFMSLLQQLTRHVELLDQRLTRLEQQSVSSKSERPRPKTGRRSSKSSRT